MNSKKMLILRLISKDDLSQSKGANNAMSCLNRVLFPIQLDVFCLLLLNNQLVLRHINIKLNVGTDIKLSYSNILRYDRLIAGTDWIIVIMIDFVG